MKTKRSLLLLTGIALAVGYSPAAADTLKGCPRAATMPSYTDTQNFIVLLDGKVSLLSQVPPWAEQEADVASIEIRCWDPRTGDFAPDMVSGEGGVTVIVFITMAFASSDERVAEHDAEASKAMQELWDEVYGWWQ